MIYLYLLLHNILYICIRWIHDYITPTSFLYIYMLHILHTEYILHTQCIFVHSIPRDDKHTIIAYTPLLHTQYILHTPYIFIHRIPRDALAGHRERESSWIAKRERVRGTQRCTCGTSTAATSFKLNTLGYRKKKEAKLMIWNTFSNSLATL